MNLLTDWEFLSVITALLAIILSQLPPIAILMKSSKLELEVHPRIWLTHKVGNPSLYIHLLLQNIGGRKIRINKIYTKVYRDGKEILNLPGQTYVESPKDSVSILLTKFNLNPSEEWRNQTTFLNYFNRDEEELYKNAEIKLRNEITNLKKESPDEIVHASSEFTEPFKKLFKEKFKWTRGNYTIEIHIDTDKEKTNTTKKYIFTIFDSQTEDLKKSQENFATGQGIFWEDSSYYSGFWINIEEKPKS